MNKTPWFDGFTTNPVRRGVYERRVKQGGYWLTFFALWDGGHWRVGQATARFAAGEPYISMHQNDGEWRGLLAYKL